MLDKKELEMLYVQCGMNTKEISELKGCAISTVCKWIKRHGITARKPGFPKGTKFSASHRRKISNSKRGSNHPNFGGKNKIHGKRLWYKCPNGNVVSMRSRWEVAFAEYLNENQKTWQYESRTFNLSDGSAYTPDFYIEDDDEYIEIKGWFTSKHRNRIANFRKQHPNIKLTVLQKKNLQYLGIDLDRDLPGLPAPKNKCELCGNMFLRNYPKQRFCCVRCRNKWIANNKGVADHAPTEKRRYRGNQTGSKNSSSKLCEDDVVEIISLRKNGMKLKDISSTKNISIGNIENILKGRSWKHVTKDLI